METAFVTLIVLVVLFAILAFIDGVFLHLYKYRLYAHSESKFEHLTHTIRAFLFLGIVYFLYYKIEYNSFFYFGLLLVAIDIIVLTVDAYVEKDSRTFMGGLPRWEYILHLFVNGFHFAGIAVILIIKIRLTENGIMFNSSFQNAASFDIFRIISLNLMPGAFVIALLHILPYFSKADLLPKFKCC